MAYNTRRSGGAGGDGLNNIGARRNAPLGNNFVPGGQLPQMNRPPGNQQRQQNFNGQNGDWRPQQPPQQRVQQQQQPQQQQQIPKPQVMQQSAPAPVPAPNISEDFKSGDVSLDEEQPKKKFWMKGGKITRKERQRRRNVRLSKILQPKNAVMILNELVKSATYTVTDIPQPGDMNQYTATVCVEGINHIGNGRSKMEAKNSAAENALKYIVKHRQFSALRKDVEGEEKMDTGDEEAPSMPWQHVASFALFKLLNAWGEDPNQNRLNLGGGSQSSADSPVTNKPAKKLPDNAPHINPLMLMNQMLPQAQFEEFGRTGNAPHTVFTFRCNIDGQTFMGSGPNKKIAKKIVAFAVCSKILNIQYPPEVYTPVKN